MNENEYINISKAFSSSLVEKTDASIALNSFVPINKVAKAKGFAHLFYTIPPIPLNLLTNSDIF